MKKQKGITLIAVIVTVIVMLILAGVSINLAIGNNGIINNSQKSAEKTNISESKEHIIEAWGYTLGKYENLDEMSIEDINNYVAPYFSNYMASYGVSLITAKMISKNTDDYAFEISLKLKGDEEEKTFYIVNDTDVYEKEEFNQKYKSNTFDKIEK